MKRPSKFDIRSFANSVQLKFSLIFLSIIAGLLIFLNIYPPIMSRDLVFITKQKSMQSQASVMSAALSTPNDLTNGTVNDVVSLLDLRSLTRVIVTDENAMILYDTSQYDSAVGRYALFSEISRAMNGKMVCHCVYDGGAFKTCEAMPIKHEGATVGAVYLYEYDTEQAQLIGDIQKSLSSATLVIGIVAIIIVIFFSGTLTKRITVLAKATKIVSEGDYDFHIEVSGHDELSELAEEFNNLTLRLKDTDELRRRFVSDASHELKTPLSSIRLLSDSIVNAENMDAETMRDFVTDIGNEADRLQRTTEKLLSLTRMDSHLTVTRDLIEMKKVVKKTLHLLSPLAEQRNVTIETELQKGCTIYGSEDLLYRIVFNLAENSIKYNMPGGTIFIYLARDDEKVVLTIEDTGIGIPQDDMPHIFSRFYRVDKARSREAGGSGLGLSIVYDAVKLHDGTISVEAREEKGSRFIVTFPAGSRLTNDESESQ